MKIGKSNYNNGSNKKHYHKLAKGEGVVGVFRFLPPLGDLADKGVWAVFYRVHYGYKNSENRIKPFLSPEVVNRTNKMVEVVDAAKRRIDNLRAQYAEAKQAGNQDEMKRLKDLLRVYNLESRWHMNAIDLSGKIGLLKLPHTAKKDLDAEIRKLEAKGIDPTSIEQGRFFAIIRNIDGQKVSYKVQVYKEEVDTKEFGKVERDVVHVLTEDIISRLETEAFELDKLYKAPTAEQVERIVREGAKAVDEILGVGTQGNYGNSSSSGNGPEDEEEIVSDEDLDNLAEEISEQKSPVNTAHFFSPPNSVAKETVVGSGKKNMKISRAISENAAINTQAKLTNDKIANMSSEDFLAAIENGTL